MGLHFTAALLQDGWANDVRLTLDGSRIAKVERDVAAWPDDERAGIGLPGIANLHSHAFQRGMAGLTERRGKGGHSFWTWRTLMYRFVERITPDDLEAIAAQAYVEMVEAGFTRVGEFHYLHHDLAGRTYGNIGEMAVRLAAAAEQSGVGLTLLPVFYAHGGFGGAAVGAAQARFLNDPDSYDELIDASRRAVAGLDGAVVGVAPHSLRAVTPDELKAILPLAETAPIHIHIAEQTAEWDRAKGMALMENWIQAYGDRIDAVFAQNDEMAMGALLALEQAQAHAARRNKVVLVGVDAIADALQAVRDGRMDATVFQDAKGQGSTAVDIAVKIIRKQPHDKQVYIPFQLVTKDNVAQYLKPAP